MLFNSYVFLFAFLPVVLLGYHACARAGLHRFALAWLALASIVFYGWWDPRYVPLLLGSIVFNYMAGRHLARRVDRRQGTGWLLGGSVAANLALLGYYKYTGFFLTNVNAAFSTGLTVPVIVLPLGISFFTFTQVAFLVDAARGKTREYDWLRYVLFVTYFPHLIAGPVLHHAEMMPQFSRRGRGGLEALDLAVGATVFFVGLFKKVVIADTFALDATPVFAAAENGLDPGFLAAWTGALAYTLQLYFDFSGYSDMAIGLSRMFGIKLPLNFDSPYQATSIIEFWRRWHMTLSRFLRDYLYIALGGNRRGALRRYANLFVTMLLGGLWHGAGWNYVIWGALHGSFLMVNTLWREQLRIRVDTWWSRLLARALTLLAVVVGWVFFRAETLSGALTLLAAMVNLPDAFRSLLGSFVPTLEALGVGFSGGALTGAGALLAKFGFWLAVLWYWPNTQQWMADYGPALLPKNCGESGRPLLLRCIGAWCPDRIHAVITATIAVAGIINLSHASEFLYFQF